MAQLLPIKHAVTVLAPGGFMFFRITLCMGIEIFIFPSGRCADRITAAAADIEVIIADHH